MGQRELPTALTKEEFEKRYKMGARTMMELDTKLAKEMVKSSTFFNYRKIFNLLKREI